MIEYPIFFVLLVIIVFTCSMSCYHYGYIATGFSLIYPAIAMFISFGLSILYLYLEMYYEQKGKNPPCILRIYGIVSSILCLLSITILHIMLGTWLLHYIYMI